MDTIRFRAGAGVALTVLLIAGCESEPINPNPPPPPPPPPAPVTEVLLMAGDIGYCTRNVDEATADLIDELEGTVVAVGDMLQEHGPGHSYETCYEPSWGRHLERTWAVMGNHEYWANDPNPAFAYFGDRVGPRDRGYYHKQMGEWLVVFLNSNNAFVSAAAGSEQEQWLRDLLAEHAETKCVLAVWHHARFYTGGPTAVNASMRAFWQALYDAGADVVVNGHFHHYERYGLQDPDANPDPERGIRQFTVGTGGGGRDGLSTASPNVEARGQPQGGILELTLKPDSYEWRFVPVPGETFTDSGSQACH